MRLNSWVYWCAMKKIPIHTYCCTQNLLAVLFQKKYKYWISDFLFWKNQKNLLWPYSLPHFWPISWSGRWVGVVGGGGGPVGLTPSPSLPRTTVLTTVRSRGVLLKEKCNQEMMNLILHNRYLWTISKRIAVRDSSIARRINYSVRPEQRNFSS